MLSVNAVAADVDTIQYASVSKAFEKLKAEPSAVISEKQGWTIISFEKEISFVFWFFAPKVNQVSPAVFKKIIAPNNGVIETKIISLREASQAVCKEITQQFKNINN